MAYIYLEELEKILPGILNQWMEKDESVEWIFQEIEQKCHVGKKKKKSKKNVDIDALVKRLQDLNKEVEEMHREFIDTKNNVTQLGLSMKDMGSEIKHIREDCKAAKSMAETAKQRTEVDYSKYSGKSDGTVSYDSTSEDINQWCNEHESDRSRFNNKCASCKHIRTEPYDQPCIGCCYNGMNISGMDKWEAKENE